MVRQSASPSSSPQEDFNQISVGRYPSSCEEADFNGRSLIDLHRKASGRFLLHLTAPSRCRMCDRTWSLFKMFSTWFLPGNFGRDLNLASMTVVLWTLQTFQRPLSRLSEAMPSGSPKLLICVSWICRVWLVTFLTNSACTTIFQKEDVRTHFGPNLVHGEEFSSGDFIAKDSQEHWLVLVLEGC